MNSFKTMGLDPLLEKSLEQLNFTEPTPIQAQTIPLALEGKDILGSAQTGTGKTLAFAIPLVERLLKNPTETALVLVPTRELAQQVHQATRQLLGAKSALRSALLIGGEPFFKQVQQLRAKARILVGTPGRTIDHAKQGTVSFTETHFVVLDETDRMFDMGFEQQIEQIMKQLPQERQTLMFSATIPNSIMKTASRYLKNAERIAIGKESAPANKVTQEAVFVNDGEKEAKLIELLATHEKSTIIFVKTKRSAEKLADKLSEYDFKATALHGDLRQNKRERVVASFRKGTYTILVATDIAARGIDISSVRHIINFDLPTNPEDYIHRIGRTGRAGAEGFSVSFVTPKEKRNWAIINRFANADGEVSDSDRAVLSERPRRPRRDGGSSRFGGGKFEGRRGSDRGGDRGGFGGRRDGGSRFGGSSDRFGSEDRPARRPRTFISDSAAPDATPSFGGSDSAGQERSFERAPRRTFDRSSDRGGRPSFGRDRDNGGEGRRSFGGPRRDGDRPFERRPRFDRGSEGGSDRPAFNRFGDKPFDGERRSSFRKEGGFQKRDDFKRDGGFKRDGFKRDGFKRSDSFGGGSDRKERSSFGSSDFKKKRFED